MTKTISYLFSNLRIFSFFQRTILWAGVLALLGLGLAVRLFDLTDPPLEYHPTRQLRGAIIARSIYYSWLPDADAVQRGLAMDFAASTGQYEPPILESLAAAGYMLAGGEYIWIARIINSIFWLVGGLALFALAGRIASPGGALLALGFYLLLPFAVQSSRTFQPDPGMTMWVILTAYAMFRWSETPKWKWAVLAGLLAGMAILTKAVAVYLVAGAAIAVVLHTYKIFTFWKRPQVWGMALLIVVPSVIFYLFQHQGKAADYFANWTLALSHLIIEPQFYVRWLSFMQDLMGFAVVMLALVGVLLAPRRGRALLLGLWVGYLIYGLTMPYQMYTHSYYHIQLVPIIALSLSPLVQPVLDKVAQQGWFWKILLAGVVLLAIIFPCVVAITTQKAEDHRTDPAYWEKIGALLPVGGKIVALTQDYGYPLMYYGWRKVSLWQTRGEQELADLRGREKEFENRFTSQTEGMDYFLITAFKQFDQQVSIKKFLYDNFPVFAEGKGYLIFDLAHPLNP